MANDYALVQADIVTLRDVPKVGFIGQRKGKSEIRNFRSELLVIENNRRCELTPNIDAIAAIMMPCRVPLVAFSSIDTPLLCVFILWLFS